MSSIKREKKIGKIQYSTSLFKLQPSFEDVSTAIGEVAESTVALSSEAPGQMGNCPGLNQLGQPGAVFPLIWKRTKSCVLLIWVTSFSSHLTSGS